MSDSLDENQIAHARWFVAHKRRWPLCLPTFLGAGLAVYCLLVTQGRIAALAHLPQSRAAVAALAPAPVPESENAAPIWIEMQKEMRSNSFEGTLLGAHYSSTTQVFGQSVGASTLKYKKSEWQAKSTYADNSAARIWVRMSDKALALSESAASKSGCNWGIDYNTVVSEGLFSGIPMRDVARLLATQARIAAFDNDWKKAEGSFCIMMRASDDLLCERTEMNVLTAMAIDGMVIDALEDCLAVAQSPPPIDALKRLRDFCRQRLNSSLHVADANETTKRFACLRVDRQGAGQDPMHLFTSSNRPVLMDLFPIIYSSSRAFTEQAGNKVVATARELETSGRFHLVDLDRECNEARANLLYFDIIPSDRLKISWLADRSGWRVAMASLASLEYRLTHEGQWPTTLADTGLEPEYLKDPRDPDQHPLRFKVADGALVVWSVKMADSLSSDFVFRTPPLSESTEPKKEIKP